MPNAEDPPPSAAYYSYRVHWSAVDETFIGTVTEFPSLAWAANQECQALSGIQSLVASALRDMLDDGEVAPSAQPPISPHVDCAH
ncbi:hypothetical protein FB562_0454 [Homoserinimonas aerilata]|uniref:Uncharacterized protein n=1 Tax=Homoserinimonas aerilata TaxID=1162970 RepID=A0A542YH52_9MICO|nr:hypothetical protein FB562_0454 [Homoserinimonas aerilata]